MIFASQEKVARNKRNEVKQVSNRFINKEKFILNEPIKN